MATKSITLGNSSNTVNVTCNGTITGSMVYNAVWNDIADCIEVPNDTDLEYGYCYSFDGSAYTKTKSYLEADKLIMGIHSDTYGFGIGIKPEEIKQLKTAVAGFVLAYVDKEYLPGTALTCSENGYLTKIKDKDKQLYPERVVAQYWKPETAAQWGTEDRLIEVNGRHWVKVV